LFNFLVKKLPEIWKNSYRKIEPNPADVAVALADGVATLKGQRSGC
jgi:hypothetical protein